MTLFVDRREDQKAHGAPALTPYLRRYITPASDVDNTTELDSGDVVHNGIGPGGRVLSIAYEIKHVSDALACMVDGRLAGEDGQLDRMQKAYDVRWVIIEDRIEPDPDSGVLLKKIGGVRLFGKRKGSNTAAAKTKRKRTSITDSLAVADKGRWVPAMYGGSKHVLYSTLVKYLTISCFNYGCMLWRTSSREETAMFLAAEYLMWQKEYEQHKSIRTFNAAEQSKRPMYLPPERKLRAKIANCFENVGYERACAVAREYENDDVDEMLRSMKMDGKRLMTVEGVGKGLVRSIGEQMKGRRRR